MNLEADRLLVIVNHPPLLNGGKGATYDLQDVKRNALSAFGVEPELRAESQVTLSLVRAVSRSSLVEGDTWPGFVELPSPDHVHEPDFSQKPVVGRHSRNSKYKWPSTLAAIRGVYGTNENYSVRVMGGISDLSKDAQKFLQNESEVLDFDALPVVEFLKGIDFWVYFHSDNLTESFGMSIVEAMASGCVVILPEYMRKNFGEGALYASPSEIRDIVSEYWGNPSLYKEQVERGREVVARIYSKEAFLGRLKENVL